MKKDLSFTFSNSFIYHFSATSKPDLRIKPSPSATASGEGSFMSLAVTEKSGRIIAFTFSQLSFSSKDTAPRAPTHAQKYPLPVRTSSKASISHSIHLIAHLTSPRMKISSFEKAPALANILFSFSQQ
jgi:hypothetical protein